MKNIKRIIFIFITVFITGQSFCSDAGNSVSWKLYKNRTIGFSIEYPDNYSVDKSYLYSLLGPGKDIHGVSFTIPPSFANGTNLSTETYISVEWMPAGVSCKAHDFLSTQSDEYSGTTETGINYTIAERTDAAMGNLYYETVYCVQSGSHCFGVRLFIHSSNINNYDPGTVKEFHKVALLSVYYQMVETFKAW